MRSFNFEMVLNNVSQLKHIQLTKHMQKIYHVYDIQHSGILSF